MVRSTLKKIKEFKLYAMSCDLLYPMVTPQVLKNIMTLMQQMEAVLWLKNIQDLKVVFMELQEISIQTR